ncbi:gag polymerase env [Lasallia pustulata]|uniref:Gag polymerase env n=1 Tax=Lasallia pustulata TaxID=136370 RepID=A0A1W5D6Z3_9LECA|nr:gag polymerase env [Lasallia pustulata]
MWGNVVDLSQSVVLTITVYDSDNQPYRYKSRFLVSQNITPAPFILGLPFLVNVNPNHDYNTGRFQWRKGKHSKAQQMFSASEKKALKGVLHMSNLTITDNFIGPVDLIANMEEYAVKMNSLQYNKYDNVYNILPPEYHNFADIFQAAEKQSLRKRASPVIFVPKANRSLQLVVDYKHLNDITIKNHYPLPLILDMLDRLQGAKMFTKLDCKDAYNRVQIKGRDEWKTVFCMQFGLFKYLAIPFGLTNAPATFQAFIDKALGEFLDIIVVVYLDDILIFSKDEMKHEEHVQQCTFNVTEVDFLGFKINTEGIYMDLERIRAIEEWQPPANVHELQVFLGFANFFCRFIRNYSQIAAPLLNLLKTGKDKKKIGIEAWQTNIISKNVVPKNVVPAPFPLSKAAMEAFKALKEAFTSAPLLRYFDGNKPMRVKTDASAFAIGRILTQRFEVDSHLHWLSIMYYSKKLLDTETQYGTGEQELLAIMEAMHHWWHYCRGARHPIVVLTDYANLVWFMITPNLLRRQLK